MHCYRPLLLSFVTTHCLLHKFVLTAAKAVGYTDIYPFLAVSCSIGNFANESWTNLRFTAIQRMKCLSFRNSDSNDKLAVMEAEPFDAWFPFVKDCGINVLLAIFVWKKNKMFLYEE